MDQNVWVSERGNERERRKRKENKERREGRKAGRGLPSECFMGVLHHPTIAELRERSIVARDAASPPTQTNFAPKPAQQYINTSVTHAHTHPRPRPLPPTPTHANNLSHLSINTSFFTYPSLIAINSPLSLPLLTLITQALDHALPLSLPTPTVLIPLLYPP